MHSPMRMPRHTAALCAILAAASLTACETYSYSAADQPDHQRHHLEPPSIRDVGEVVGAAVLGTLSGMGQSGFSHQWSL